MAETETARVVGIDLGTTNSLVAFMQGDQPQVIPGDDGSKLVPSVVALPAAGKERVVVGNRARSHLLETPDRAIYSVKRLMGRGVDDVAEELKLFPFRLAPDIHERRGVGVGGGRRPGQTPGVSG